MEMWSRHEHQVLIEMIPAACFIDGMLHRRNNKNTLDVVAHIVENILKTVILVTHIPANKMETIMLEADNAAHMLSLSSWEQALAKPCCLAGTTSPCILLGQIAACLRSTFTPFSNHGFTDPLATESLENTNKKLGFESVGFLTDGF